MSRLWLLLLCSPVYADSQLDVGATWLSDDWSGGVFVLLEERVYKNRIGLGIGYTSDQTVTDRGGVFDEVPANIFVSVHRYFHIGPVEIGVGPAYFQNTNRALSRNLVIGASIGLTYKRFAIRFRHYSNAGSGPIECEGPPWKCKGNMGQDALVLSYRF